MPLLSHCIVVVIATVATAIPGSLNLGSVEVQISLATCGRLALMGTFVDGPEWKWGWAYFGRSIISPKQSSSNSRKN